MAPKAIQLTLIHIITFTRPYIVVTCQWYLSSGSSSEPAIPWYDYPIESHASFVFTTFSRTLLEIMITIRSVKRISHNDFLTQQHFVTTLFCHDDFFEVVIIVIVTKMPWCRKVVVTKKFSKKTPLIRRHATRTTWRMPSESYFLGTLGSCRQ